MLSISSASRVSGSDAGAEGLDVDGERVRDADGVGELQLAAAREPRRHDVLRHVARHVGAGAVDLGRVLAAERPAAVARVPP